MQIDRELYEILGDENERNINVASKNRKNGHAVKQRKTRSPLKQLD